MVDFTIFYSFPKKTTNEMRMRKTNAEDSYHISFQVDIFAVLFRPLFPVPQDSLEGRWSVHD